MFDLIVIVARAVFAAEEVIYADLVAVPEALPVGSSIASACGGMPVFVAVLDIGLAMIFKVLARTFNAVMETLRFGALNVRRYGGPGFVSVIRPIAWRALL